MLPTQKQLEAYVSHDIHRETLAEIGDRLGISKQAVWGRLSRAKARMRNGRMRKSTG